MSAGVQLWTTGPAFLFTNVGTGIVFLGTAQSAPEIEVTPSFTPIMNDMSGQRLPMDRHYDGTEAIITAIFTRWNFSALMSMFNRPFATALQGAGTNSIFDMGTIMGQEGATYPLWVWFPKAPVAAGGANPANAYATMVPGYRFWSTLMIGPERISPGTKALTQSVVIQAQRAFTTFTDPVPGNIYDGGSGAAFKLYDHDMTGISAALIT
jgi:hypothetical protein